MMYQQKKSIMRFVLFFIAFLLPLGCANFLPGLNQPVQPENRPPKEVVPPRPSEAPPPVSAATPVVVKETARLPQLAGIAFNQNGRSWRIDESGQLIELGAALTAPVFSPDASQVLFTQENDVWLLTGGQARNLTNTPDAAETGYFWHPLDPQVVFFITLPPGETQTGYLATMRTDGSGFQVLDREHPTAYAAISPDGRRIAYGWDSGWIYEEAGSITKFDPAEYQQGNFYRLGNPSWSPDGLKLAWIVSGGVKGYEAVGVAVFNLPEQAGYLHYAFAAGLDDATYPGPVLWSPDGLWLAFHHPTSNSPESEGLWVIASDGRSDLQFLLGKDFTNPVWSPGGQWLAFNRPGPDGSLSTWLAVPGNWMLAPTDLPAGATITGWR